MRDMVGFDRDQEDVVLVQLVIVEMEQLAPIEECAQSIMEIVAPWLPV